MVVRVARLQLIHGLFISQGASAVVELVGVLIERLDRRNIVTFALCLGASQLRFFYRGNSSFQISRAGRLPDLMVVRHGDSPVGRAARGVFLCDISESVVSLLVPKRMKHRHGTAELRLKRWFAGNGETHLAEF